MPRNLKRRGAGRGCTFAAIVAWAWIALPSAAAAQDAKAVVEAASKAMGANTLTSITYSGSAAQGNFGQSRTISFGLASTAIRNYTRTFDFTQPASHATGVATPPAVAGAPRPESRPYDQLITPTTSAWSQQLQIWVTPWGFLRGAATNGATVRTRKISDVPYKLVTWVPPQKAPSGQPYKVVGYIKRQGKPQYAFSLLEAPDGDEEPGMEDDLSDALHTHVDGGVPARRRGRGATRGSRQIGADDPDVHGHAGTLRRAAPLTGLPRRRAVPCWAAPDGYRNPSAA